MNASPKRRIVPVDSCVDYQSYVYKIDPDFLPEQYECTRRRLLTLGNADEERMGVVYVRGPWGFFIIPHFGYPTLRVSFYHDTPISEINKILSLICEAFEAQQLDNTQGGLDG